ncbi:MAG: lysozyme inhibitor LprI family protein [Methylococcales bacterium]|jgi:uncharacterized protein|nr:lysozyme inhibitor LprI family protein [Methylococcales bacterium]
MTKIRRYLLLSAISMTSFHAHGAGFNCVNASKTVEKAICADTILSDLDSLLLQAYKKASANSSNPAALKKDQQTWLKSVRDVCPMGTDCLRQVYTARLAELEFITHENVKLPAIAGKYQRKPDKTSTINVQDLKNGQWHITGNATWTGDVSTGNVNVGEIEGTFPLDGDTLYYSNAEDECKLTLTFAKQALTVNGDNGNCGGHNVSFDGQYKKSK